MKSKYQAFLKKCAPFEWIVGIIIESLPIYIAFELIRSHQLPSDTSFLLGIVFHIFYRPYDIVLSKWRKDI